MRFSISLFAQVAIVIFLTFVVVDRIVYPPSKYPGVSTLFLGLRLTCALAYLPVLLMAPRVRKAWLLWSVAAFEVWWVSLIICVMLTYTGYEQSLYYAGLIVTMLGAGLIFPFTWHESLPIGLGMAFMYLGVGFANPDRDWRAVLNNVFFILGALGIVLVAKRRSLRIEQREFEGRKQLAEAADKLRELDHAKSDFIANISHEMRTPLMLMLGPLESLASSVDVSRDEHSVEYMDLVRRNSMRLFRLINDLLDLAKMEAAQVRLRLEPFDLTELLEGIVAQARPMLACRNITLDVAMPPAPVSATLDASTVEKAVINLVSNAIKFTPAGGRIRLTLDVTDDRIRIAVADSGIGIAPHDQARIFERFSQVDAGSTRSRGGTGIGLALVKELVELHQGSVSVESALGAGSTFTLVFPGDPATIPAERVDRRVAQLDTPVYRRNDDTGLGSWVQTLTGSAEYRFADVIEGSDRPVAEPSPGRPRAATLLVVEDSADLRRFLSLQLATDYRVLTAADGAEGWEKAKAERPDLVLTDLMMPRLGGYGLIERLRADPDTRHMPVIMLTARGQEADRIKARNAGADIYLTKPFSASEVKAAIGVLLKRGEERVASLHQETVASLSMLMAGMAHELLNPVGFISNSLCCLDLAVGDLVDAAAHDPAGATAENVTEKSVECRQLIHAAREGVGRITSLVGYLRSVSAARRGATVVELADLNESLTSTLLLVGAKSNPKIRVHVDLCPNARVPCQVGTLNQVFLNLLKNALLALKDGEGQIWVTSRWMDGELVIEIADDGCGIPAQQVDRVFDPFFTTRDPGKGTGLGLALCQELVARQGGRINLSSIENEGTRVAVCLPAERSMVESTNGAATLAACDDAYDRGPRPSKRSGGARWNENSPAPKSW